jgi:hypothetical protein
VVRHCLCTVSAIKYRRHRTALIVLRLAGLPRCHRAEQFRKNLITVCPGISRNRWGGFSFSFALWTECNPRRYSQCQTWISPKTLHFLCRSLCVIYHLYSWVAGSAYGAKVTILQVYIENNITRLVNSKRRLFLASRYASHLRSRWDKLLAMHACGSSIAIYKSRSVRNVPKVIGILIKTSSIWSTDVPRLYGTVCMIQCQARQAARSGNSEFCGWYHTGCTVQFHPSEEARMM